MIDGVDIFTHAAAITKSIGERDTIFDYVGRKAWAKKINNLRIIEFDKQNKIFGIRFSNDSDRMTTLKYEPFIPKRLTLKEQDAMLKAVEDPISDWMEAKYRTITQLLVDGHHPSVSLADI